MAPAAVMRLQNEAVPNMDLDDNLVAYQQVLEEKPKKGRYELSIKKFPVDPSSQLQY